MLMIKKCVFVYRFAIKKIINFFIELKHGISIDDNYLQYVITYGILHISPRYGIFFQ